MTREAIRFMRHTRSVMVDAHETRRVSAAVFGNEKTVEVILAVQSSGGLARATDIVQTTGIAHGMVRPVLKRLLDAGVLTAMPRRGGSRGELFFEIGNIDLWAAVLATAQQIVMLTQATSQDPAVNRTGSSGS